MEQTRTATGNHRRYGRIVAAAAVVALLFAALPAMTASATVSGDTAFEECLASHINATRTAAGLNALAVTSVNLDYARNHDVAMANAGKTYHDGPDALRAAKNAVGASWAGENVGAIDGNRCPELHAGFLNSPLHYDTIMRVDATQMTIGVVHSYNTMWLNRMHDDIAWVTEIIYAGGTVTTAPPTTAPPTTAPPTTAPPTTAPPTTAPPTTAPPTTAPPTTAPPTTAPPTTAPPTTVPPTTASPVTAPPTTAPSSVTTTTTTPQLPLADAPIDLAGLVGQPLANAAASLDIAEVVAVPSDMARNTVLNLDAADPAHIIATVSGGAHVAHLYIGETSIVSVAGYELVGRDHPADGEWVVTYRVYSIYVRAVGVLLIQ